MGNCMIVRKMSKTNLNEVLKQVSNTNINTNWKYIGKELSKFTLDEDSLCRFGYASRWDYKILKKGTYDINKSIFYGTDPYPGIDKELYKYTGKL